MEGCIKNCFLIAAAKKECQLKKLGLNLPILKFTDNNESVELVIVSKGNEKKFNVSFSGESAYLENPEYKAPGGRPTYCVDDMVVYLFILANGGPVFGKLIYPGTEEKKFLRVPAVAPT